MDFLNKSLVKSFHMTFCGEEGTKQTRINGRVFYKCGIYQSVTLVGNLYEYYDPIVEHHKKILMVGVAKQHPCDLTINKKQGIEIANENAHVNPAIVIQVKDNFKFEDFEMLSSAFMASCINREFVKTNKEINDMNIYEK